MAEGDRSYIVGQTVVMSAKVSDPKNLKPADPSQGVTLASVVGPDGAVTIAAPAFTRLRAGDYQYRLSTAGLTPGTYDITVIVSGGDLAVVPIRDRFVLSA